MAGCDCIFCVSRCPECGSANVNVRYVVEYNYNNSEGNKEISIGKEVTHVEIDCQDCDAAISGMPFSSDENEKLNKAYSAISKILDLADTYDVKLNDNHKIKVTAWGNAD